MDKVKTMILAGARTGTAIREVLLQNGLTVVDFAKKHGLNEKGVSNAFHGNVRATDALIEGLCKELGGTADEWRVLLWEASKPSSLVA